jgi:molybdopterin/thiamine biosynthesis adenylyltransferase
MKKGAKTEDKLTMIEEDRYKRQILIWGEEGQARLNKARVAIIGLGAQGKYASLCCTALGIGNIILIDGKDAEKGELFLDKALAPGSKALSIAEHLREINKQISVEGYQTDLESRIDQVLLTGAHAIIDTTNSIRSKQMAINYGSEKGIPVLTTSSKWGYTKLMHARPQAKDAACLMTMFEGSEQDELMALVMCGIATEEIRKIIFNEQDAFLMHPVRYRLGSGYRYGFPANEDEIPKPSQELYKKLKILMMGGGGIGNWGAVTGSKMGIGTLDVVDYDKFDSTNIHRQILGADGIDELKAEHVAKKIGLMSRGKTSSAGINQLILPGFKTAKKYDVVLDFVDNPYTRAINTAYAIANQIPMISSGTLPSSARVITQVKGSTQCQDCIYDIYNEGRKDEMIRRASCAANPNPSVVMSNALAGAVAMLELYTIVEPEKFGRPFNGEQTYRATSPKRFGTNPLDSPCDCYSKPVPNLEISQDEVDAFVKANPHLIMDPR